MGIVVQRGGGLSLPATVVKTDQANTYSAGAQSFAAAATLIVPSAAGSAPTANGDLRFDTTRRSFVAGSASTAAKGFLPRLLSTVVTGSDSLSAATISTTETIFATLYTVPADFFSVNKLLDLWWLGKYTASASPPTAIFRLRYGGIAGTILYTSNTLAMPASRTTEGWSLGLFVGNIGASGAAASLYTQAPGQSPTGAGALPPTNNRTNQPVTADTTSAKDMVLTLQFSANTAGNSVDLQILRVVEW